MNYLGKKRAPRKLTAYTDASISQAGEGTGAVVFVRSDKKGLLQSVSLLNFGFRVAVTNAHTEMEALIEAMHLTPKRSLSHLVSDNDGAVSLLQRYQKSRESMAKIMNLIGQNGLDRLDSGLRRHPELRIEYNSREKYMMRIVDSFSRLARGGRTGIHHVEIPDADKIGKQRDIIVKTMMNPPVSLVVSLGAVAVLSADLQEVSSRIIPAPDKPPEQEVPSMIVIDIAEDRDEDSLLIIGPGL